ESRPARIRIEDVTFTYPGGAEPTLRGLTFDIRAGETLALVGENGAGKTTLVKLLARLYDPTDGRILFDGADLRSIAPEEHLKRVGFVLQGFGRYETTVAENLAYGDWRRLLGDEEAIRDLAEATNVASLVEAMPEGYETHLGRMFGTHTLSGGQWQRLAVARAFARDCSFLVLDEPTSNLDALAERELFRRFKELSAGRTTLLISHRFTTLGMADRIVFIGRGRVVEIGTHVELMERRGAYASLYRVYEDLRPAAPSSSPEVSGRG
ncbi:MAG: ABC transporter ATP-binding protein, partial [Gemmatimonadota bacterium]